MSLRVFCGPFTPALERAALGRLRELRPGPDRPVALVAPSRRLAGRLERLTAVEGGLATLGLRFHTLHSLALEALEGGGGPKARMVSDPLFHDKLLDRLLVDAGARPSRGLAAAYRASLRDLIDGGVEPEQFSEHLEPLIGVPEERRRLAALLALQGGYRRVLERLGVLPPSGLAREAAEAAAGGRAERLARYVEILYFGFYDLTGAQADFFDAVTGAFPCSVFFPYRKGHPGFAFAKRFYDQRLGRGKVVHLSPELESLAAGSALEALFSPGARAEPAPRALRVFSASGARDEVWLVAKEILALRGARNPPAFSDVGVVARSLEPYRAAVAQVFEENAIPFWTDAGGPLLRHPAAKLALTLLTLRARGYPARAVLDVVQSPFWRPGAEALRAAAAWPSIVRRLGLHSGLTQWAGRLRPWLEKDLPLLADAGGPAASAGSVAALWGWLEALERALAGPAGVARDPWPAMATHARRVLESQFGPPARGEEGEAYAAALDAVDSLAAFGPAAPEADFREFLETLEEKLRRAELPPAPENRGVRVLDAMAARGESFKHLFLIGLQERVFPRQVREDPLLPDAVRARLQHPGGYWILPKLEGYAEERLLFTLLAGSATGTLTCVFPRSNEEGRAQVPSIYLRELCRAAGVDLERAGRVPRRPFEKLAFAGAARWSPKEAALAVAAREGAGAGALAGLGVDAELLEACRRRLGELNRHGEPGAVDGVIGPPSEWLKAARKTGFSPTALEEYVRCPFQFFAARLLALGEVEEPAARGEVAPAARGKLVHAALERFHRAVARLPHGEASSRGGQSLSLAPPPGGGASSGWGAGWEPELERALQETFGKAGWEELGVYPVVWEATRRRLEARLRRLAELDLARIAATGVVPRRFEVELAGEVAGIPMRGRADRIDEGPGGKVWVVDYKSGSGPAKLRDRLKRMGTLQPPIYLELAVAAGLGTVEGAAGAALYCLEGAGDRAGEPAIVALEGDAWRALREEFWRKLALHVASIGRGEFFIAPDERVGGACGWCSFAAVCRKSHGPTARRALASKALAAHLAARELGV